MARGRAARSPQPFTVPVPRPLPVERHGEHWWTEAGGVRQRLSNLDKVFWPEEGYTKGDLVAYYYNVAEVILPYLAGRPLTMNRMPEGCGGPHFYEKNAPPHTPAWVSRCALAADEEPGRLIEYLVVDSLPSLLYVVNLGCIEMHPLHSRCDAPDLPDYLIFDLDPFPPASFEDVVAVALHVRAALQALGLSSYPKTSGATGMQVYVPVRRGPSYRQVRELVEIVGRHILRADPGRVTMEWEVARRAGKVFVDHHMNRRGANIVSAYSLRPQPKATVSTPLRWEEVAAGFDPRDFTIVTLHDRLARLGDPFRGVVERPEDLSGALAALGIHPPQPQTSGPNRTALAAHDAPQPQTSGPNQTALAAHDAPQPPPTHPATLADYAAKRDFSRTPEPPPGPPSPSGGSRFVIHKHHATRLHYDLRLERDGVLKSWALPKGLPVRPGARHLAVQTEDHPLEYAGFEGTIPPGQYGAGEVRIFDSGTYEAGSWEDDKITFRLHGRRLRGEWHLVRTPQGWLALLSRRWASDLPPEPPPFEPMLAEAAPEPFDDPAWRFEPKLDGVRTLAYVCPEGTRLWSRRRRDHTASYPELGNLAAWVNAQWAVLDGEIVALGPDGRPSFERLAQRVNLTSPREVERARLQVPVVLYVFDLLWLDGDLTALPLQERRRRLEEAVSPGGPLRLTTYTDGEGVALFEAARAVGFEGIVAKRLASPYRPGRRSRDWRKVKARRTADCVILGWTPGTGSRAGTFGALLLGAWRGGRLRWVGQVGTGFTEALLSELTRRLQALEAGRPPCDDPELASVRGARWVRPELVCEVEYLEVTGGGKLRAPSFKRLRTDKAPEDCRWE